MSSSSGRGSSSLARARQLPDEKTLEKVSRYETHLSRGLCGPPRVGDPTAQGSGWRYSPGQAGRGRIGG